MTAKPSVSLFRYLDLLLPPDPIALFVRYGPVLAYPGPDKVRYRLLRSDRSVQ
jgi:hypothetical protein